MSQKPSEIQRQWLEHEAVMRGVETSSTESTAELGQKIVKSFQSQEGQEESGHWFSRLNPKS